jgi:hypothetical protein
VLALRATLFRLMIVSLLLGLVPTRGFAEGRLSQARGEVRTASAPSEPAEKKKSHDHDDDCSCSDCCGHSTSGGPIFEFVAGAVVIVATSPFWGPPVLVGDRYADRLSFLDYPYQHGYASGIVFDTQPDFGNYFVRNWQSRLQSEYIDNFDGLQSYAGQFIFESNFRLGFDTSMQYRREGITGGAVDELWTGDANVVFRFAQSEHLMMRTGIGFNWLSDDFGSDFGFNFTYSGDLFPCDPWVISAEMDLGKLGSATLVHLRSTVGVQFHRFEVYTGFDYYNVGGVGLNGLVAGVRLWW